jgi:hypothetical protein
VELLLELAWLMLRSLAVMYVAFFGTYWLLLVLGIIPEKPASRGRTGVR